MKNFMIFHFSFLSNFMSFIFFYETKLKIKKPLTFKNLFLIYEKFQNKMKNETKNLQ